MNCQVVYGQVPSTCFGLMERDGPGVGAEGRVPWDHVVLESVLKDKEYLRRRRGVQVEGGSSWQGTV